jgi:hypothetical protein
MNQQISTALADLPNFPMAATKPSAAHSRRCSVCRHPDRIWIELKFIEWHSPTRIAEQFELYDPDCISHHAHATNLYQLRLRNILCIYQHILERSLETHITSHGVMLAIDRLERAVRSQLPNPATELETTLTRDTELTFVPKSTWGENDKGNEEQTQNEPKDSQPGNPAPETAAQAGNSDSGQNQHTPAQVPHSKRAKTPESRSSFRDQMRDPNLTSEAKSAIVHEHFAQFYRMTGPPKRKPPH